MRLGRKYIWFDSYKEFEEFIQKHGLETWNVINVYYGVTGGTIYKGDARIGKFRVYTRGKNEGKVKVYSPYLYKMIRGNQNENSQNN